MKRHKELKRKKIFKYNLSLGIITKKKHKKEIDYIKKLKETK